MVHRTRLFPALLTGLLALWGSSANEVQAAGYAIFTQGASALGQGNAVTAHGDGPSSIFYNPALLGGLEGTQLEVGTTAVFSGHRFQSDQPGGSTSSNDSIFTPSTLYLSHRFGEIVSAGFGVFTPFGLGTEWGNGWDGRYLATTSTLQSFDLNPVLCYRVLPRLSIAAGLDIILVDAVLERQLPPAVFGTPADVGQRFKGSGTGVGYNIGLAYRINDEFSLGASYRSEAKVELKGEASTSLGGTPLDSGGRATIVLPQQVTAGVAWRVSAPLTVEAGIRWEGWSAFKELQLALDNGTPLPATERSWHDSFGFNRGEGTAWVTRWRSRRATSSATARSPTAPSTRRYRMRRPTCSASARTSTTGGTGSP